MIDTRFYIKKKLCALDGLDLPVPPEEPPAALHNVQANIGASPRYHLYGSLHTSLSLVQPYIHLNPSYVLNYRQEVCLFESHIHCFSDFHIMFL